MKKLLTILLIIVTASISIISPTYAASASFGVSGGGKVTTNQTINITITANASEAFNALSITVNFNNLVFISASQGAGWTPISGPARNGNQVSFSGALLGSSATSKAVLYLSFRAPSAPGSSFVKASGAVALVNGGTQVPAGSNTASYNVSAPPVVITAAPTPTPKPAPGQVAVSSSTHPDQAKWYKLKDVTLNWIKQDGVTDFSYAFDTNPSTTPDDNSKGADIGKTFLAQTDGVMYFHIKGKNDVGWGPVTHYTVRIDTKQPDPFTVTKTESSANKDKYQLFFATNDAGSGVEKYETKVDGQAIDGQTGIEVSKNVKEITVNAYDKAGNMRETSLSIDLSPIQTVITTNTNSTNMPLVSNKGNSKELSPFLLIVPVVFLASLILGLIAYKLMKKKKSNLLMSEAKKISVPDNLQTSTLTDFGIPNQVLTPPHPTDINNREIKLDPEKDLKEK